MYLSKSWVEVVVDDFPVLRVELDAVRDESVLSGSVDQFDVLRVAGERETELLPVPGRAVASGLDAHAEAPHAPKLVALVQIERVGLALVTGVSGREFLNTKNNFSTKFNITGKFYSQFFV